MNNNYTLTEVSNKRTIREFLDFPSTLYKDDKNWIRPLDIDIEKIFNPKKNRLFKRGKAIRWILKDANHKVIGRIAAFYDEKTAIKNDQPTGGCGFFDCINDKNTAKILFDSSKQWLEKQGMEAMDGPINFGSREHFWGCLSDGFYEPVYNMPYNHSYYNELFESYGFKNYFNQFTFHAPFAAGNLDPVISENAASIRKDPTITFEFHNKKNPQRTADYFMKIFNAAWAKFPGVKPVTQEQVNALFKSMKQIIDPKLIIFAFHNNSPIAFFIMIPDLYQIIRKFNGKFNIINKLRLLYYLKVRKVCTRSLGLIFGVIPEFQGKGIAEGMIVFMEDEITKGVNYTDLEMNWIGDFNPRMIKLVKKIGGKVRKTHITYRYLFDRNKEFKRAKIL
ncbi:MAG: hypothetical protein H8E34_03680 [Bacteroidetes bacterium]|nr:hypothetical protein [Bacteroidota bacterium]MBL6944627.1 hypothetical protein [Bacteroidales bacterium]